MQNCVSSYVQKQFANIYLIIYSISICKFANLHIYVSLSMYSNFNIFVNFSMPLCWNSVCTITRLLHEIKQFFPLSFLRFSFLYSYKISNPLSLFATRTFKTLQIINDPTRQFLLQSNKLYFLLHCYVQCHSTGCARSTVSVTRSAVRGGGGTGERVQCGLATSVHWLFVESGGHCVCPHQVVRIHVSVLTSAMPSVASGYLFHLPSFFLIIKFRCMKIM